MCELTTLKVDRGEQGQEGTSQQTVRAYWSHDVTTSCDVMSFLSTPQSKIYSLSCGGNSERSPRAERSGPFGFEMDPPEGWGSFTFGILPRSITTEFCSSCAIYDFSFVVCLSLCSALDVTRAQASAGAYLCGSRWTVSTQGGFVESDNRERCGNRQAAQAQAPSEEVGELPFEVRG